MTDEDNDRGEKVTVDAPGYLLEEWHDGSALIDIDGSEILLPPEEWQYQEAEDQ